MKKVLKLLRKYSDRHNYSCSFRIFIDGSGRVLDRDGVEIKSFHSVKQLKKILKKQ